MSAGLDEPMIDVVWDDDEDLLDLDEALDVLGCPRCGNPEFEHDTEFHASVCDACGLWVDDPEDEGF